MDKINDELLEKNDLEILENIADKYCVSLQELGRIISRKKATYPRLQILLNKNELNIIDGRAKEKNLSRSKYCSICYKVAIENKYYEDIDILEVFSRNYSNENEKREFRAVISFDKADEYKQLKKLSKELGIPSSSLMRYFALNIEF